MLTSSNKSGRKTWRIVSSSAVVEDHSLNNAHASCLAELIRCFSGREVAIESVSIAVDPGTQLAVVTMIGSVTEGA